jgi:transcriptional regulator with XRE-family HTH domain
MTDTIRPTPTSFNSLAGMVAWTTVGHDGLMVSPASAPPFTALLRQRRSSRGWSQLELAVRVGTTQRHLSFIEQGRSQPGRTMVIRLAETLELPLRERNELLLAAGFAPAYRESDPSDATISATWEALRLIVDGHLPFPAVVVRPYGEIVLANVALDRLLEGVGAHLLVHPVNVLRVALHPDGMAPRVGNLAEWGRHIIDSLRARAIRDPTPALGTLIAELEGYVPASTLGHDHVGFAVPLRYCVDGVELSLVTTLTSFATATDVTLAELTLEAFLPGDERTSEFLRRAHEQAGTSRPSRLHPAQG